MEPIYISSGEEDSDDNEQVQIAVDIGQHNLAYACSRGGRIIDCNLESVYTKGINCQELAQNAIDLVVKLIEKYGVIGIKRVLLEKQVPFQPARPYSQAGSINSRIECALHTAFLSAGIATEVVIPARTFSRDKVSYYQRKKRSSRLALLRMASKHESNEFFSKHAVAQWYSFEKKDDLSDCFNMLWNLDCNKCK